MMTAYEQGVWRSLNDHWRRRNNRRGLPGWANTALEGVSTTARAAGSRVAEGVPDKFKEPVRHMADLVADRALDPTVEALTRLLEFVDDWARELTDPRKVEALARKRGVAIESFADLKQQELKACDRLLTRNTLQWRGLGALEGGAMGALALVPVAGLPIALTADVLIVQVLSVSLASRVAYSYGFDAKDPAEEEFIQRLVRRSFVTQAAKAKPIGDAARAAQAARGRVRWSEKLRNDHRLLNAIETLLARLGPEGSRVSVQQVAKVVPVVGILLGAGANAAILGNVAEDARRYCQTRFLCDKYGLPLPAALATSGAADAAPVDD